MKFLIAIALSLPLLASAQVAKVVTEHVAEHVAKELSTDATNRMACKSRDPAVDRHACMREMVNAAAAKGQLTSPTPAQLEANKTARCDVFGPDDTKRSKQRCLARLKAGDTSGDVDKGGTITELHEIVPAK